MSAGGIKPEDCTETCGALAINRKVYPVFNRSLARGCRTPDVTRLDSVAVKHCAVFKDHLHCARVGKLEGCWVRAVFLSLLCHQADVLHCAGCCRVQGAVFFEELDALVINRSVGVVGDDTVGITLFAVRAPPFATRTNEGGHGGIDDHI